MATIKGYKVFNPDWTCRGFQYKVGETFTHNGDIEMCGSGFHFCRKASDCFNYYDFNSNNKVAEVEAVGLVKTQGDKSVTDKIKIVCEIEWQELLTIVNEGNNCTGLCNTGNGNTGDRNTGGWNSTNYSTGFFNSEQQPIYMFNKPTTYKSRGEINNLKGMIALDCHFKDNWRVNSEHMTNEEKEAHPEHETTGGYLKTVDFKTACEMMWSKLSDDEKSAVMQLPNFDAEVFEDITGINVNSNDL